VRSTKIPEPKALPPSVKDKASKVITINKGAEAKK
tara:strand:+ start:6405 stop:6509 length:105 start_codon:yes stop_codon:yes gene_type:complete